MSTTKQRQIALLKVHMAPSAHEALRGVLESGLLADGAQVRQFEDLLRAFVGNPNVTGVSDISGGISLALFMAGVRPDDEVIVSPMTCTATTMPIANLFARPVWCDVDPHTGLMDPAGIAELVTPRTKAVLIHHWAGEVADLDAIIDVAGAHGLRTIDDAADAFGADYRGRRVGNNGVDFTAYSFQAVKHLTTGEGGALFFASAEDADRAQWLKRYGIHRPSFRLPDGEINDRSDIPAAGYNFYLNNIAAAIGIEQFAHADRLVARHRANGAFYNEALAGTPGLELLRRSPESVSGYWAYTLLAERRDDLRRRLKEQGVGASRFHVRNDIYSCFDAVRRELPGVDHFDSHTLSIPCGWWVEDEDREYIADVIRQGW